MGKNQHVTPHPDGWQVKGRGNSYDFGARLYDSRLGRWLTIDPLSEKFPSISPYVFVANSPLIFVDPDGQDIIIYPDNKRQKPYVYGSDSKVQGISL